MVIRAIVQARMLSKRLRGKSLMSVAGKPLLLRVLERLEAMSFLNEVVVATSTDAADEPIAALVRSRGMRCVRGDRENVLSRFVHASADMEPTDTVVRFTADNPLYDPMRSAAALRLHLDTGADYTHVEGLSHMVPEIVRVGALRLVAEEAREPFDREHVTPFLRKNPARFRVNRLPSDFGGLRPDLDPLLTIDSQADVERLEQMLGDIEQPSHFVTLDECYLWLDRSRHGLPGKTDAGSRPLRIKLAGREVGDGCPCFVVAEIGQNHNGQLGMAKRLIEIAARCGADAVKFQKRDIRWELTEEAYNRPYDNPNSFGKTYGLHREYLEFDESQHAALKEFATANNVVYFCTACDPPSVEAMERIGNPIYKIASRDITNIPLLRVVAQTRRPVIISTGMAGLDEIREALDALGDLPESVMLMQCVSQYPAAPENLNLRAIDALRREFAVPVGLSDHSPGFITAVAGSVLGACLVEKHITLSRAMQGTDHAAALEEDDLRTMVRHIRTCELAMGDGRKVFNPAVESAKAKLSRSLTSARAIAAGELLTEEMLVLKSPGDGISWRDRGRVVGRRARRDIPANVTLAVTDFE